MYYVLRDEKQEKIQLFYDTTFWNFLQDLALNPYKRRAVQHLPPPQKKELCCWFINLNLIGLNFLDWVFA